MSAGIAIFVKTPGYSPVKSRLAAECGRAYAEAWYLRAAAAVASVARTTAADAKASASTGRWRSPPRSKAVRGPAFPMLGQGEGGLGERMARVHARAGRGARRGRIDRRGHAAAVLGAAARGDRVACGSRGRD